jgi:aminoglycoside phosphotransferase family enzyme
MDLERYGRSDLSQAFSERYLSKTGCIENKTDEQLFLFYKLYRANVRLKIHAIEAQEANSADDQREEEMRTIRQYLELCKKYSKDMKST